MEERRKLVRRAADRMLLERVARAAAQGAREADAAEAEQRRQFRRRAIRHHCKLHLALRVTHSAGGDAHWNVDLFPIKGRLLDLSGTGAQLFTSNVLEIGQGVSMVIELPKYRPLQVSANVVWCKTVAEKGGHASGVRFHQMPPPARAQVTAFIEHLDRTMGL